MHRNDIRTGNVAFRTQKPIRMKIPSNHLIERAAESLDDALYFLQKSGGKVADQVSTDTSRLLKQARYKLRHGAEKAVEIEERVVADVKARPLAYTLIGVGLLALLLLKLGWPRHESDDSE